MFYIFSALKAIQKHMHATCNHYCKLQSRAATFSLHTFSVSPEIWCWQIWHILTCYLALHSGLLPRSSLPSYKSSFFWYVTADISRNFQVVPYEKNSCKIAVRPQWLLRHLCYLLVQKVTHDCMSWQQNAGYMYAGIHAAMHEPVPPTFHCHLHAHCFWLFQHLRFPYLHIYLFSTGALKYPDTGIPIVIPSLENLLYEYHGLQLSTFLKKIRETKISTKVGRALTSSLTKISFILQFGRYA